MIGNIYEIRQPIVSEILAAVEAALVLTLIFEGVNDVNLDP